MSIIITSVEDTSDSEDSRKYKYKDIYFGLSENVLPEDSAYYGKTTSTDLQASYDEGAIMNSLTNLFNTVPGQKVLNPAYGVNLTQWLFEPLNEFTAREIGEAILSGIERFEPRVNLTHIDVVADYTKDQYIIQLAIQIPSLNITRTYSSALMQTGFQFLTNNE